MKPEVCAAGILAKDNKILLGKRHANRDFHPNTWDLPGGHCVDGEIPAETLIRELQEELGITPTEFNYLTLLHEPKIDLYGEYDYHSYLITAWQGIVANLVPGEHSKIQRFLPTDAIALELAHPNYPELFRKLEK